MPDHPVVRFAERLLVALLWVYPSSFRRRVGTELVATYRDRCRDEWVSWGWFGLVSYWTRTAMSVAKHGILERLANRSGSFAPKSKPQRMDSLIQDLHYTIRSFGRRPAFFLVALITVALGIGSTTTIYSVVDGVLFRALPYPNADRLVQLGALFPGRVRMSPVSQLNLRDWQERNTVFESLAAARLDPATTLRSE